MNHLFSYLITTVYAEEIQQIPFKSSVGLDIAQCGANGTITPDGGFLACYISSLYTFFVQGAIVLAVVMIMFGGFQWLLATGNASKISEAKSTISAAIFGLILALTSYLLFAQINKNLVDLQTLDIDKVNIELPPSATVNYTPGASKACNGYDAAALDLLGSSRKVLTIGNINMAQLSTLTPQLAASLDSLDAILGLKENFPAVRITSITQDAIFSGGCTRTNGVMSAGCEHAATSDHYGGVRFYCENFDREHPPVSCAADLAFEKNLSPTLKAQYYPILFEAVQKAGLDRSWCEIPGDNPPHTPRPCTIANIDHLHAALQICRSKGQ